MAAEGVLRPVLQEDLHAPGVELAHLVAETPVEVAHRSHRVGHQGVVVEVAAPPVGGAVVKGHGRAEGEGALALPLLGGGARIGPRGERALAGVGQAGQRGHHRSRVAVGPDDAGVGIGGTEGIEMPEVVGGLEDPALGGLMALEGLEGEPVLGVGRGHVRLLQPTTVRGHMGLGLEGQGAHVVHEERHALLGQRGPERVHGLERGIELHQPVELLGRPGDAGILVPLLQGRRRDRDGPPPTAGGDGPPGRGPTASTARWSRSGAGPR